MATEYISREAAVKAICGDCSDKMKSLCALEAPCKKKSRTEKVPAADVVEVVRCKDCRYFHNGYDEKCCINHKGVVATDENGFCHHAERRGEDG